MLFLHQLIMYYNTKIDTVKKNVQIVNVKQEILDQIPAQIKYAFA